MPADPPEELGATLGDTAACVTECAPHNVNKGPAATCETARAHVTRAQNSKRASCPAQCAWISPRDPMAHDMAPVRRAQTRRATGRHPRAMRLARGWRGGE